jgi:hypothetical protein
MQTIQISEFKALCLRLLDQVKRSRKSLLVTRNGEPLVIISPAPQRIQRAPFGALRETGKVLGDLTAPASDETDWEVLK